MNVVVLGAAGNMGRRLVRAGLDAGHRVTALARSRARLEQALGQLEGVAVIDGDVEDAATLDRALDGQHAAVNAALTVMDGERFTRACAGIIAAAERRLPSPGRLWLYAGAAALTVPGTGLLGVDLPGVPGQYQLHAANFRALARSTLDWSLICPGPMVPAAGAAPRADLRVSVDVMPFEVPGWLTRAPRVGLSLLFKRRLPELIVTYEDVARLVMTHLEPGGPYSRHRVGVALPAGERGKKPGW